MKHKTTNTICPCGSGQPYSLCCEPLHHGFPAKSAEALMRSRYSAFAMGLRDYILSSWHPETRPDTLDLSEEKTKWLDLEIKEHRNFEDDTATVEFIARYKTNGKAGKLHELSRFRKEQQHWYYLDGDLIVST